MVATNTIAQGDTRETGLAVILRSNGTIVSADRFLKWGGDANVEVNLVNIRKGATETAAPGALLVDGCRVQFISSLLDDLPETEPNVLVQNSKKAFVGEVIRGVGFVLDSAEVATLTASEPRNMDCLRPFLNGKDVNEHPHQATDRSVICFEDWPIGRRAYPNLLKIAEERVRPQRMRLPPSTPDYRKLRDRWWQFADLGLTCGGQSRNSREFWPEVLLASFIHWCS